MPMFGPGGFKALRNQLRNLFGGGGGAPSISPGLTWNGTAGSGYGGTPPTITGTPYPIAPWLGHMGSTGASNSNGTKAPAGQFLFTQDFFPDAPFTGDILLSIEAQDYDDNCTVTFYCEGNTAVVTESQRSLVPISAPEGTRYHRCYAATLKWSAFSGNGAVDVYALISSARAGMTNRVIGPIRLFRRSVPDRTISVGTGQPTVVGVSYPTLQAAVAYCSTNSTDAWIKLALTSNLNVDSSVTSWGTTKENSVSRRGIVDIDPGAYSLTVLRTTSKNLMRPGCNGLVWRNTTFDITNISSIFNETGLSTTAGYRPMVAIGGEVYSQNGQYEVFQDQTLRSTGALRPTMVLIGVHLHDFETGNNSPHQMIGCTLENLCNDLNYITGWTNTSTEQSPGLTIQCVIKNNSQVGFTDGVSAWTASYSGAGTATIELSGQHNSSSRQAICKVNGTTVGTFTASTTVGSGNYKVSNFVSAANAALGASGWTFTTLDDTRKFAASGAETGTDIYTLPASPGVSTIKTYFWVHMDAVQFSPTTHHDNNMLMGNQYFYNNVQYFPVTQSTSVATYNSFVRNNIITNQSPDGVDDQLLLQFEGTYHHFCFDHNTCPNEQMTTRYDVYSTSLDADCAIRCNIGRRGQYAGTFGGSAPYGSNHLFAANTWGGTNDTVGGTMSGDFPNFATAATVLSTYTPALGQALYSNLKTPAVKYDRNGKRRAVNDLAGAVAA